MTADESAQALRDREPLLRAGGTPLRALLTAFALLILLAPAGFYGELVYRGTFDFSAGAPAMAPLFVLFLLALINPALGRIGLRAFQRRELLVIYTIVLVGSPLISHGLLPWLLPYTIAQQYLSRAIVEWQTSYLPAVPSWFGTTDWIAAEGYFQGHMAVPWQLWWTPLAVWLSFLAALFGSTLCLMALLQGQWIAHERLAFPIAQVPLEMVQEAGGPHPRGRFPSSWPFWIGFIIPCAIGIINKLSTLLPTIPAIPVSGYTLMQGAGTGPWAGIGAITLELTPWIIAIAYLIPKELAFSCWFFWFVRVALTVTAISLGASAEPPEGWYESGFPAPHHQGGGAVIALAFWTLWIARRHLSRGLRLALRPRTGDSEDEPLAYRWAILGFIVCFGYLIGFCIAAGVRPLLAAAMVGLIVTYYLVWARLRAETGVSFMSFPFRVDEMLVVPAGSAIFRLREIIMLYDLRWAYYPGGCQSAEVLTGNVLEAFKIANSARIRSRPLLAAMVVGFALSLVVTTYVVLAGMYHYGFQNTRANSGSSGWLGPQLLFIGGRIFEKITSPTTFDLNAIIAVLVGAGVTIGLGLMRLRFWWWPFHPIGYLAASCWGMQYLWMPFLVGWALKTLSVRYGGLPLYRRTVPLAIGLIVGDFVNQGVWVAVSVATRGVV